ncbi:MAG: UDP-N-acetylmuramoyl-L-alanine--D-glutamate ligase, partial [Clostridia bacterium]|nr:UDP-N-acetylmuramoyl-L-alanine--D-glutamate ligase [Clostridia bacterium]
MAAILATRDFAKKESAESTACTFAGVPHRLQLICEKDGVKFYNSSIDSSPSRTCAALSCFSGDYNGKINIILGGYDKHIPFDELAKPLCEKNCKLYITGHTAQKIYKAVTESEYFKANPVKIYMCKNFDEAVISAKNNAKSGEIVLLSPACASFDEFANFEKRGERFAFLVNA